MSGKKNNIKRNSPIKAGIGYTIGNYLIKGLGFLTLPLFTRLLSTSDFGIYNTFMAYESILFVIIGFAIHSSYKNARYKYKTVAEGAEIGKDYQSYISSTMILLVIGLIFWLVIINTFANFLYEVLRLKRLQQNILVFYAFSSAVIVCYNSYVGIDYQYKNFLKVAAINSVCNIGLSIALVLTIYSSKRYMGRIIGTVVPSFIIAIVIVIYFLSLSKPRNVSLFLKWGMKYSLPIVPHGLSQIILSSFDRIMILHMVSASAAGIYSFAHTVCTLVQVTATSLDTVWTPWFYEKKNQKKEETIKKYGSLYAIFIFIFSTIIMLIAPELLKFLGPKEYADSLYCVIPLITGAFFAFLYNLPASVEYYYEKTQFIAIGTMSAAIINIVLNYIFIKKIGYTAAAYTTLVTYFLYFVFHYFLAKKIEGRFIYSNKVMLILSIGILFANFTSIGLLSYAIIRWGLVIVISFLSVLIEEKKYGYGKKIIKNKFNT